MTDGEWDLDDDLRYDWSEERIAAAAVRGKSYFSRKEMVWSVTPPGRHCDLMQVGTEAMRRSNVDHPRVAALDAERLPAESEPLEQGFVTSKGRFVDRKEGKTIARSAGQLLPGASPSAELFSEDLW